jgi:hypothetical protein
VVPSWSRDGNSIYFASNRTGRWQVWKHSVASGEESQVTRNGGCAVLESYDLGEVGTVCRHAGWDLSHRFVGRGGPDARLLRSSHSTHDVGARAQGESEARELQSHRHTGRPNRSLCARGKTRLDTDGGENSVAACLRAWHLLEAGECVHCLTRSLTSRRALSVRAARGGWPVLRLSKSPAHSGADARAGSASVGS